jgi:N-glycosylase/DNA lyase
VRLAGPIDLAHSLHGGQAFLWTREGDTFTGRIEGHPVVLTQDGDEVTAAGAPRAAFARYFRLEPADAARRARLARDPALAPAMAALPGLRLLRQDPWETTVAFLTSANNNVLRIELILRNLVAKYGEEGAFPAPERLARATEPALRACGLGYRAPFLRQSARMVAARDIDLAGLRGAPWPEAREALLELPGVGPKVADCIALFALDCDEAFPVDRWILRAVADVSGRELAPREAVAWAHARWGKDAGLAQQYLFHAVRLAARAPGTRRVKTAPEKG